VQKFNHKWAEGENTDSCINSASTPRKGKPARTAVSGGEVRGKKIKQ